jgi:hypothetical protein
MAHSIEIIRRLMADRWRPAVAAARIFGRRKRRPMNRRSPWNDPPASVVSLDSFDLWGAALGPVVRDAMKGVYPGVTSKAEKPPPLGRRFVKRWQSQWNFAPTPSNVIARPEPPWVAWPKYVSIPTGMQTAAAENTARPDPHPWQWTFPAESRTRTCQNEGATLSYHDYNNRILTTVSIHQ